MYKSFSAFKGASVLVTGHTGFKGAWLTTWLRLLGAEVTGFSLPEPPHEPSIFEATNMSDLLVDRRGDIRSVDSIFEGLGSQRFDFVFHLAAQALVRKSYGSPLETLDTNVMGVANVLEYVRLKSPEAVVIVVTSDKCYDNREWVHSYREVDPMGGHDPYSASKGAAELVVNCYRESFFKGGGSLASVRSGNVIGPGDWSEDRLIPDCIRAIRSETCMEIRSPNSTRPWQHVLEPLGGYLLLASKIDEARRDGGDESAVVRLSGGFNFGPNVTSNVSVGDLLRVVSEFEDLKFTEAKQAPLHEATLLSLAYDKAYHLLDWRPKLDFHETVRRTVCGYRELDESGVSFLEKEIDEFSSI